MDHCVQSPLKAYLEPSHTSKMELFQNQLTALSIFAKSSILDVLLGSKSSYIWGESGQETQATTQAPHSITSIKEK